MKKLNHTPRRAMAGVLAALMLAATVSPTALAAEAETETQSFTPACDETYYATLDEYGALTDAGVVKSYRTYGNTSVTDYGKYDEVINLSNSEEAQIDGDTVTFNVPEGTKRFYFEGKTSEPFENLPWNISVSYELNGVPAKADELAGSTGVVDITLHATPNEDASEYNKNNLVLIAASMFNGDDLLSLKAPGAQVQLLGNIYCVLYAVLPGEEQEFTISVGSDDFTYDGMIFLAVPATLEQIDKLSELRDAKDKVEDSYDAISDSLDVILDSIDGLGSDMRRTADGLDQLDKGREILEDGLPDVYKKLDNALEDVDDLGGSVTPLEKHIENAGTALEQTNTVLGSMSEKLSSLTDATTNANTLLAKTRQDINGLKKLIESETTTEGDVTTATEALDTDLANLKESLEDFSATATELKTNITAAKTQIGSVGTTTDDSTQKTEVTVKVGSTDYTVEQIESLVSTATTLHEQYEQYLTAKGLTEENVTFTQFLTSLVGQVDGITAENAPLLAQLYTKSLTDEYKQQIKLAKEANAGLALFDGDMENVETAVDALSDTTTPILTQVEELTDSLSALTGRLEEICDPAADLLGDADGALYLTGEVGKKLSTCSADLQSLAKLINVSLPEVKSTIKDATDFTSTASDTLDDLARAGKSALRVIRSADGPINIGTEDVLESLSDALRQTATGIDKTSTIKNAKDVITSLIEDEWNEHTGDVDNLLLMDNDAECESMTDTRNEGVASVQYIMRTAEIKHADDGAESDETAAADNGTFLSRVGTMFSDIWNSITGIFKKK